jgi:hypothetical protein
MVVWSPFNVITYTVCAPKINLHYFCTFVWGVFHPLIRTSPLASPLLLLFYVCSVEMAASQDFLPKDLKIPCILTFVEETTSVVITLQNLMHYHGLKKGDKICSSYKIQRKSWVFKSNERCMLNWSFIGVPETKQQHS